MPTMFRKTATDHSRSEQVVHELCATLEQNSRGQCLEEEAAVCQQRQECRDHEQVPGPTQQSDALCLVG